jgi:hypothetical protein
MIVRLALTVLTYHLAWLHAVKLESRKLAVCNVFLFTVTFIVIYLRLSHCDSGCELLTEASRFLPVLSGS